MSDANRTALRVSRETSPKVVPENPLFHPLRLLSIGLNYTPETVTSSELDDTRQVSDQPLIGFTSGGDVPTELSIGNTDPVLPGVFMHEWVRTPEVLNGASWKYGSGSSAATRISALTSTTLTLAATSVLSGTQINADGTAFVVGTLMYFSGFGGPDQILRASASGATSVTVAGATAYASPPATARVKAIGFEGVAGDITSVTVGGNALVSTTLNFTTLKLNVGQYVYLSAPGSSYGFAAFGGFARISAIAANRLSFDRVPTGFVADAAAGKTIRVFFTDFIKNGVAEGISYTMEQQFGLTAGTRFQYHRGQEANSRVISAETKAIITETINFMGLDATPMSASRLTGSVTLPRTSGTVLNSSTAIPLLYEGGVPVTTPNFVNSFTISLENNKRNRDAVAVLGAAGIGSGRCNVTGTLSTYFGNESLYNKVISNEISSVTIGFSDPASSLAEIYDVPRVKYSAGSPAVTGIDTDIMADLTYQGLRDPSRDYTISLSRFEYYL